MTQLGVSGDERLEPERPERATVVGHDRHQRHHVALLVAAAEVDQRRAGQPLRLGQRELDRSDGVVLVRRG